MTSVQVLSGLASKIFYFSLTATVFMFVSLVLLSGLRLQGFLAD
jgi:hypothetical protein